MSDSPGNGRAARRSWTRETRVIATIAMIAGSAGSAGSATIAGSAGSAAISTIPVAGSGVTLQPVPPVDAGAMEPAVRRQVEAAQRSLAGAATLPAAAAARTFGEAGKTFAIYLLVDSALACFENAAALAPQDFRWPYYAGLAARTRGDLDRARAHFQHALELKSPLPATLVRLGELEILRHDFAAADRAYTAALAFPDTAAAAHFGLGRVALLRGDARLAAEHFEATLAAQPAASIVHSQLAIAYRRLGQLDKATAQAAARGSTEVSFVDPLVSQMEAPNASHESLVTAAFQRLREGRRAEAAEAFRQAAAVNPQDERAWLGLGYAQEMLGDTTAAEQSFRRAVEADPQDGRAHMKLGTILAQRGARGEGIEQLKTAVRLRPDLKDAHFNLATALAQEGRLGEAEAECNALLQLAPQDREALALRNQLRADLGAQPGKEPSPPPH